MARTQHLVEGSGPEVGSAMAELVIVTPLLLILAMFMVLLGRIQGVQSAVAAATRAGVQAAVAQADSSSAASSASGAVRASLVSAGIYCPAPRIGVDISSFQPGGSVSVSVSCTVPLKDLGVPGFPTSKTVSAFAAAPVDPYKEVVP